MTTYTVIVFKQADNEIDALFALNERLEYVSSESYTDIAEAYEKLTEAQTEGKTAIVLSDSLLTDLAVRAIKQKQAS